jgi:hypothetical protein
VLFAFHTLSIFELYLSYGGAILKIARKSLMESLITKRMLTPTIVNS